MQGDLKTSKLTPTPKKVVVSKMPTQNAHEKKPAGAIYHLRLGEPLSQVWGGHPQNTQMGELVAKGHGRLIFKRAPKKYEAETPTKTRGISFGFQVYIYICSIYNIVVIQALPQGRSWGMTQSLNNKFAACLHSHLLGRQ